MSGQRYTPEFKDEAVDKIRLGLSKDRVKASGQDWKHWKSLLRMRYKNLSEHDK